MPRTSPRWPALIGFAAFLSSSLDVSTRLIATWYYLNFATKSLDDVQMRFNQVFETCAWIVLVLQVSSSSRQRPLSFFSQPAFSVVRRDPVPVWLRATSSRETSWFD